jgi:hypothetical protein
MNPFATLLCIVTLAAALSLSGTRAQTPACAPPATTHPDKPGLKAPASSFAPHAASRHHAYGAPIQGPILRRHKAHGRHVGREPKHAPPAPTHGGQ